MILIKRLISLTKPGIIFGNLITVAAGFFLGCRGGHIHYGLLLLALLGSTLIIASGCVFNNYIDRDIDRLMERTKNRVLALGLVPPYRALFYAIILGCLGTLILVHINHLTASIAIIGLFFYVVVYSLWCKRGSIYGTLIGTISGSTPPVIGYCAATNHLDLGALILFLILSTWQMPHSYAIGIYRMQDYKAANIRLLPIVKGIATTKWHMLGYIVLFIIATLLLPIFHYTGMIYFIVALILGIGWLQLAIRGFYTKNDVIWAKKMFGFSIICITVLSITMSLNAIHI